MSNCTILRILYVAILSPLFLGWFQETIHNSTLASIASVVDELAVIIIFSFTLARKGQRRNTLFLNLTILLFIIGFVSGLNSKFNVVVNVLGGFNICKSLILYWCLCQYSFKSEELHKFFHWFTKFFPVIFCSYVIEIFYTNFRAALGFEIQGLQYRNGLRCLGSIFSRFTYASLWGLLYYVIYTKYELKKKSLWKSRFGIFMVAATLKIKDIFGIAIVYVLDKFKQIKLYYVIPISILIFFLVWGYEFFFPEHYNTYFGEDSDGAIRNVMTLTSLKILKDYFPLGVGWGKFGSATSAQYVSEVYNNYGIEGMWGLDYNGNHSFMQDTQWPMFFGETGVLGTLLFLSLLYIAFFPYLKAYLRNTGNKYCVLPALLFIYFILVSIGKPVFVAVPHSYVLWGFAGIFYNLNKSNLNK